MLHELEQSLHGLPDLVLSVILISVAICLLIVALAAPSTLKAVIVAWVLLP